jgi:MSHA biogenesis protein MshQ
VQLSGKPSNIGFNADTFKIEAVKTDDATGACAPLLITGESIEMAASYQSPGTGTELVNISGQNIGTAITGTVFDSLPFIAVPLDFGGITQHSAEYIFTYPDAGSVVLNARYELPDDEGNPSGDFIKGTSNPIIVRPFAFDMFVDKNLPTGDTAYKVNPAATDGSGGEEDVFTVAADEIRISTRAVAWKTGDDANDNGLADQGEDLTTNATTNNFIDVSLSSLSHKQLLPTSDIDGALSVETGAEFTSGSQVDIATYDEVGIISLQALKEDYLAAGVSIEGNTPYVGRFIPSHFTVTSIADGILTGTCSVDDSAELPFVYSGQMLSGSPTRGALSYLTTPSFVIEARNKDDVLTQNYIDDFLKLSLTSFQRLMVPNFAVPSVSTLAPVTDTSRMGKDTTNLVHLTANLDDANFTGVKGVISYSYHDEDNFVYAHEENSEVNEFTSDIDLSMVSIIDSDTVAAQDYDLDSSNGLILTLKPSGKLIRFGRAQLANSYGPDTSNLPQTLSVNYYTDDGYVLSENDTCTTYDYNNIFLSNISLDPALSPVQIIVPGKFSDELPLGETRDIILEAPTDNIKGVNTGQVGVIYNISDWLQYDWAYDTEGVDGLFNDNPRGIATFGIYRGNDRIIYQREVLP